MNSRPLSLFLASLILCGVSTAQARTESTCEAELRLEALRDQLPGPRFARPLLAHLLGIAHMERLRVQANQGPEAHNFIARSLLAHGNAAELRAEDRARIPKEGGLIVTANHSFGFLEALLLADLLDAERPGKVKVLANSKLRFIPELEPHMITVQLDEGSGFANAKALIRAKKWVRDGNVLLIFPSGEVSFPQRDFGRVMDPEWKAQMAAWMLQVGAPILPFRVHGENSLLFQTVARLNRDWKIGLLPHEFRRLKGSRVSFSMGQILEPALLAANFQDEPERLAEFLRLYTYSLGTETRLFPPRRRSPDEIANSVEPDKLEEERNSEPSTQVLFENPRLKKTIFLLGPEHERHILDIAVRREQSFRPLGEGSGRAYDIEAIDFRSRHLVVWDEPSRQISGAYRVSRIKPDIREAELRSTYVGQFFKTKGSEQEFADTWELSRAFVVPEHRGDLRLLWQGLAQLIIQDPSSFRFTGLVSLSQELSPASQQMIVGYWVDHFSENGWDGLIPAYEPFPFDPRHPSAQLHRPFFGSDKKDLRQIFELLEGKGKNFPELVSHYAKLQPKLLGVSVDKQFGSVDLLIEIDLKRALHEPESRRFMKVLLGSQIFRQLVEALGETEGTGRRYEN